MLDLHTVGDLGQVCHESIESFESTVLVLGGAVVTRVLSIECCLRHISGQLGLLEAVHLSLSPTLTDSIDTHQIAQGQT